MKFGHATFEDHGTLADSELDAVSGGFIADLVRQSIQLANEAQYQMWVNSVVAASAATQQSIIANI
jgi:hypothetical protein